MDFPGVVFPIGRFRSEGYQPLNVSDEVETLDEPRNATEKFIMDQWDPSTYDNASVCLQLIGRRLNEERLLGILKVVENVLHSEGN